ncbi:hypothetical protein SME36J_34850 [Serratia marcescens]|nr:hypothetical protein SME36J_34850 [Serratia marcescens]
MRAFFVLLALTVHWMREWIRVAMHGSPYLSATEPLDSISKSGRIPRPPATLSVTLPPWMMANDTVSRHFDRKMAPVVIPQKMVVLTFLKVGWMGKYFC